MKQTVVEMLGKVQNGFVKICERVKWKNLWNGEVLCRKF